jgi:hypothetical protein
MIFAVTGKLACLTNQGTLGKGVLGAKVGCADLVPRIITATFFTKRQEMTITKGLAPLTSLREWQKLASPKRANA